MQCEGSSRPCRAGSAVDGQGCTIVLVLACMGPGPYRKRENLTYLSFIPDRGHSRKILQDVICPSGTKKGQEPNNSVAAGKICSTFHSSQLLQMWTALLGHSASDAESLLHCMSLQPCRLADRTMHGLCLCVILPRFACALFCNNLSVLMCYLVPVKVSSEASRVESRACLPMHCSGYAGKLSCLGHSTAPFKRQCHTDRTLVRTRRRLGSAGNIVLIDSSHLQRFGSRSRTCALPVAAAGWRQLHADPLGTWCGPITSWTSQVSQFWRCRCCGIQAGNPSAATMAFARPWRRVEDLPPAILQSWLDEDFSFSVVDSEIVLLAAKTFLKLTPDECCYSNAEVQRLTLPVSNIHGAKVLPSPLIIFCGIPYRCSLSKDRGPVSCRWACASWADTMNCMSALEM